MKSDDALGAPDALTNILVRWSLVGRSGLLPALIEAQETYGWLSEETLTQIANGLGVPLSEAFGVANFYAHLYTCQVATTCRAISRAVRKSARRSKSI